MNTTMWQLPLTCFCGPRTTSWSICLIRSSACSGASSLILSSARTWHSTARLCNLRVRCSGPPPEPARQTRCGLPSSRRREGRQWCSCSWQSSVRTWATWRWIGSCTCSGYSASKRSSSCRATGRRREDYLSPSSWTGASQGPLEARLASLTPSCCRSSSCCCTRPRRPRSCSSPSERTTSAGGIWRDYCPWSRRHPAPPVGRSPSF
mmetsp:Transcript_33597/g.96556  ORF Transcript_33597/g.96556 Transcript_33597/m.96556 type:complete len:207 (+) Transcript_33597:846-1466(+)